LTPRHFELPGFEAAVGFEPLRAVGGDYVDIVPMPDGRVLLALADVCGNGVAAALVAIGMHATIRSSVSDGYRVVDVVERLNHYFRTHLPEGPFVTFVAVAVDVESGETEALNAGHPPLLVVHPKGATRRLRSGGTFPLGIADLDAQPLADTLKPGEVMVLATDGWTELTNAAGRMLGLNGLARYVSSAYRERGAAALAGTLREALTRLKLFQGPAQAHDDRTLLLARRQPGKANGAARR
jgi:serine phosphatase RsbU (regulator of sigma subunit)